MKYTRKTTECNTFCARVSKFTGASDGGAGTMLLIDDAYYQDVRLACPVTLNSGCDNAGLVFAYRDRLNYWVKVYSNAQDKVLIYQVSDGAWTQKSSSDYTISNGTPFTMTAEVRAGAADSYAASLPAGQVGLWCSDSSDNSFDDFQVRDIAGPFEVDGQWFCNAGEVPCRRLFASACGYRSGRICGTGLRPEDRWKRRRA